MSADELDDLDSKLRGARTCRQCLHQMDPWRSAIGRTAWHCLHCDRFEI